MKAANYARKLLLTFPLAWSAGWLLYYAYTDTLRRRIILTRVRELQSRLKVLKAEEDTEEVVSEEEKDAIRTRFASCMYAGRYWNIFVEWREQGAWEAIAMVVIKAAKFKLFRQGGNVPKDRPINDLPVELPNFELLFGSAVQVSKMQEKVEGLGEVVVGDKTTFTWIGQSTTFTQLNTLCILTDPIFSDQTLPSIVAPWRLTSVPCQLQDLRRVDMVLVSHNHFDHLDPLAIKEIGDKAQWFVPKGVGAFIRFNGVSEGRVTEMDWWDEAKFVLPGANGEGGKEFVVTATPNMHWTARHPGNTNATLSCSFHVQSLLPLSPLPTPSPSPPSSSPSLSLSLTSSALLSSPPLSLPSTPTPSLLSPASLSTSSHTLGQSFYHVGDTGYSPTLFAAIGRVLPPVTVAAIPIGSYEPRWHMRLQHTDPEGAVGIARALRAGRGVGVHWGTWIMSEEDYNQPPKDLEIARQKLGVPETTLGVIPFGRTIVV